MKTKVVGRLITIVILLIFILGGIFAYAYFGTDLLKTNEQLFFKYLGQLVDTQDGFIDRQLSEYTNKKLTGKYEDSGNFSVDMDISGMDPDMKQTLDEFNIEYSGKIDNTARKNEQNITLNYSDDVNFPFQYKYANETLGLQTDYVSSKYIGIENSNLKEFVEKFGVTDTANFPDRIDFFSNFTNQETVNLTDEEREQVINTYTGILQEKLGGKEFTKTEENDVTSYSVQITNQEVKDLLLAVLEAFKDDSILMPKVEETFKQLLDTMNETYREASSSSTYEEVTIQSMVEEMINDLENTEMNEGTNTITVSQTNRKLSAITLKTTNESTEAEIKITKTNDSGNLTYGMEMNVTDSETQDSMRYFLTASYQGLEQLTSVNETYQYGITGTIDGEEQRVVYNLNCTDTFNDGITIEDYAEDEIQVLNDYDAEEIMTLIMTIAERIGEVNAQQMEEIGFSEYGNPVMYTFPLLSLNTLIYNQATDVVDEEESTMDESNQSNTSSGDSTTSSEEMMNQLQQTSNDLTNATIEQYVGENRGSAIRDLLLYVSTTNASQTDENRKINVSGDIQMSRNETEVPSDIDTSATYNVEVTYDENENINEIIITKR